MSNSALALGCRHSSAAAFPYLSWFIDAYDDGGTAKLLSVQEQQKQRGMKREWSKKELQGTPRFLKKSGYDLTGFCRSRRSILIEYVSE